MGLDVPGKVYVPRRNNCARMLLLEHLQVLLEPINFWVVCANTAVFLRLLQPKLV